MGSMSYDGPPASMFAGMAIFVISGFLQVCVCMAVGSKYTKACQIGIDGMKQYVEVTLNEQWQKECNVRWSVTTEQTMSVHNSSNSNRQRVRVHTYYNIEVRSLVQQPQQVVQQVVMVPA